MMAAAGSLQLSHELGICKNHAHRNQFKSVARRSRLHLLSFSLSSHASRQGALTFHLSDSINRPTCSIHHRHNIFICRSFLIPGPANETSIVKSAAAVFMRSYNAFHGCSHVMQLAPAIGVILFAVWGLAPLMRHGRNVFLHQTDSSWKRSSTHYVMTSYIQPLLFWTGALLVCRALDPLILPAQASHAVKQRLLNFVRSLSTVLALAHCLSSLIQQAQKFLMETNDSYETRNMGFNFAGKAVHTAVWVAAVSLFMELLGFSTQKWLTAGGLGTVLLTLAGREILTNFLSSIMIHATRPFVLNEWIQTKIEGYEVSGTVEHVGWWSPTIIRGDDREAVHIPNHKFTVNVVRNLSQKTHWRIKTHLAISHLDVNKINNIVADMRKVLAKNPQVEQQRLHRRVFLDIIDPENQALMILVSCFVKTSHFEEYLCVKEAILLDLLRVISHHRARLATPIRTFQKRHSDADMENIPFSETIFNRGRAASQSRFLLIEPSYKITSDDKANAQARTVRANEEKDTKAIGTLTSDLNEDEEATTPLDSKASESKSDGKVATTASSESKTDPKVAAMPSSDVKADPEVAATLPDSDAASFDDFIKKNSDEQFKNLSSGDATKHSKVANTPLGTNTSASEPQLGGLNSRALNSKDVTNLPEAASEKPPVSLSEFGSGKVESVPSTTSHTKKANKRPSSVPLEDNIVLGVALEGSKRTLPIEEEEMPTPTPAETKELAACHNGNQSVSSVNDKNGQVQAGPLDQRDQER